MNKKSPSSTNYAPQGENPWSSSVDDGIFIDLASFPIQPELVRKLPEEIARYYRMAILKESEQGLMVGMVEPSDLSAYNQLTHYFSGPITIARVNEAELAFVHDLSYRQTGEISRLAKTVHENLTARRQLDLDQLSNTRDPSESPVAKLLQTIFTEAVSLRASDIHIEPEEKLIRIRYRVDGVLQEQMVHSPEIGPPLVSRLKIISELDITNKRIPQDGRFSIKVGDRVMDVRIATMPIYFGEAVVMRLLDQSDKVFRLSELGMAPALLERVKRLIRRPQGIILVTGPTGSGKTTTLYAAVNEINEAGSKIISVEDPVEYVLPRINQVQVNDAIELSFARVLRAILRHDPDIILIGEMRDVSTSEVAIRAAMTGHLVLSTIHTNDAPSAFLRLIDVGVDGYKVASTLMGIVAQRLVRRLCEHCKEQRKLTSLQTTWVREQLADKEAAPLFFRGKGCVYCNRTGYLGRTGVFELLELNDEMRHHLRRNDEVGFLNEVRRSGDLYTPMFRSALDLAVRGETTIEEVVRIFGESAIASRRPRATSAASKAPQEPGRS